MGLRRSRQVLAGAALLVAFACPATARGDAVTEWNANANAAIFAAVPPPAHAAMLSTAMVQGAVYDAANAIAGGYTRHLNPRGHKPRVPMIAFADQDLVGLCRVPSYAEEPSGSTSEGPRSARDLGITLGRLVARFRPATA